jgi:hypothetical protein
MFISFLFNLFFLFIDSKNNIDHDRIPSFTPSSTLSRSLQQTSQLTLESSTPGKRENQNDLVNTSTDSPSIGAFFEEKENNYELNDQHSTFSLKSSSSPVLNKNRKRSPNKFVASPDNNPMKIISKETVVLEDMNSSFDEFFRNEENNFDLNDQHHRNRNNRRGGTTRTMGKPPPPPLAQQQQRSTPTKASIMKKSPSQNNTNHSSSSSVNNNPTIISNSTGHSPIQYHRKLPEKERSQPITHSSSINFADLEKEVAQFMPAMDSEEEEKEKELKNDINRTFFKR